ncbi:phosphoenolpyruvate synthase [Chitinophaga sancti]|uniref:Phosphoenolpyruvate synthase n=1 Tax=Chitinophaga sancti TaxID=1004 RepID=A0A1K1SLP9_9BACT|nr:phosphoenolpyruvate synthase [Chitinophaga sancti]WQD63866.1 phosphoenolpyruvate synthase [Chitinophaga sancti]WQG90509.1 phosphoenolpyruvate synthase [Chitinophaga sancti]SFW85214.1 phosphoenolpyruvate synthase [Chitinophaga sancti]
MESFIMHFADIRLKNIPEVGGKNASLGEMYNVFKQEGILVPDGFATNAFAFWSFLDYNNLWEPLGQLMRELDRKEWSNLAEKGAAARQLILNASIPEEVVTEILFAYRGLCNKDRVLVAVRSSATAEDLPDASFAGQHESFLNIRGEQALMNAIIHCYASLYTDRAIKYREDHGFQHEKVALSVGVQLMVRSDLAASGVCFTLDPDSGFRNVVLINGIWGLGENIVQGAVVPDEYQVFKPTGTIIRKKVGSKEKMLCLAEDGSVLENLPVSLSRQQEMVLSDKEVLRLADWAMKIEKHYGRPMDIEWAKDGVSGLLYIVQARPETVHEKDDSKFLSTWHLQQKGNIVCRGIAVGNKVVAGTARILSSPADAWQVNAGDIVVTNTTSPDWDPVFKKAAALITNTGGRTSHAAIVARETGIAAIVGCKDATTAIKDGQAITVSCCEGDTGFIYEGILPFREERENLDKISLPESVLPMLIISDPAQAFRLSFYPNAGVGLLRMEFIIASFIGVHPMALVKFDELKDPVAREKIEQLTRSYPDKPAYFIDRLSQGIATIAAAFYPKQVVVRMSDFKTNEYAALLGGKQFEPEEPNPMLGFRGASRYCHDLYKDGFKLECAAIKKVRDEMGFTNVKVMIPFCRTVEEGEKVLEYMAKLGLGRGQNGLEVYVMIEIPANVIMGEKLAAIFDGFSIGSNDLTQLTLGIDRDATLIAELFNEKDPAVLKMIGETIRKAHEKIIPVGFCGQAASDFPEIALYLVKLGVTSISYMPDAILKGIEQIHIADLAAHTV